MDGKKVRQILLLLDSEQTGEQSAALDSLRALKAQGQPVLRDVFDMFDQVAEVAEERDRLKQENVNLQARLNIVRPALLPIIKAHMRTASISAATVAVVAAGLHFSFPNVEHVAAAADAQCRLNAATMPELRQRLAAAIEQLAATPHCTAARPRVPARH